MDASTDVVKKLGEFIVANNPYAPDGTKGAPPMTLKSGMKKVEVRDLLYRLLSPRYDVGGMFQLDYTYEVDVYGQPLEEPKKHRLWIVYGSGGNGE